MKEEGNLSRIHRLTRRRRRRRRGLGRKYEVTGVDGWREGWRESERGRDRLEIDRAVKLLAILKFLE